MDCFLCSAVFADDFEGVSQALLQGAAEYCHCEECNDEAISFSVGPASCRSFELTGKMPVPLNPCPTTGDCFGLRPCNEKYNGISGNVM